MKALVLPILLAASGCMAMTPPTGGIDAAAPAAGMRCDAEEAQQFIGRKATDALGQTLLSMTKSRTLRWGGPETAFTMDYREDRVNVIYDAGGTITRIYCG